MGLRLHSMQIKCFHVTKIKQNLVFPTCAAHLTSKMARNSCGVHLGKHFLDVKRSLYKIGEREMFRNNPSIILLVGLLTEELVYIWMNMYVHTVDQCEF